MIGNNDPHSCTIDITIGRRRKRKAPLWSKDANGLFKQRHCERKSRKASLTKHDRFRTSCRLCKISQGTPRTSRSLTHTDRHRWAYQKRPTFGVRSSAVKMKPWVALHICSKEPCSPNRALQTASSAAVQTSIQKQKVRSTGTKLVPPALPGDWPEMELSMGTGT
jgi:hypothetical protein